MMLRRAARTRTRAPIELDGHYSILALLGVRIAPALLPAPLRAYSQLSRTSPVDIGRVGKNRIGRGESSKRTLCELAEVERIAYSPYITASTSSKSNPSLPFSAIC